jgi:hypothetical protein
VGKQASERPATPQTHQQTFVLQSAREAASSAFFSETLVFRVDAFRDSSELVGDHEEAIAPSGKRRQKTGDEPQDWIRWI